MKSTEPSVLAGQLVVVIAIDYNKTNGNGHTVVHLNWKRWLIARIRKNVQKTLSLNLVNLSYNIRYHTYTIVLNLHMQYVV